MNHRKCVSVLLTFCLRQSHDEMPLIKKATKRSIELANVKTRKCHKFVLFRHLVLSAHCKSIN